MEGDGENESFVLVNCMLVQVLKPINIVVKQLQSSHENLSSALSVLTGAREELTSMREELNEEKVENILLEFKKSVNDTFGREKKNKYAFSF